MRAQAPRQRRQQSLQHGFRDGLAVCDASNGGGIESGADEVMADELTRRVHAQLGEPIQARLQGASPT